MNVKVIKDRRSDIEKRFDEMWNKMVRDAGLNARQRVTVQAYLRSLLRIKMNEVMAAMEMSYLLALIKSEKFGTDPRKSTRLLRVQKAAAEELDDVYKKGFINANGVWDDYDGCGVDRLKARLGNYGIDYDIKIGV